MEWSDGMGQLASQLQRGLCLATILSVASGPHLESRASVAVETFLAGSETTYKECMKVVGLKLNCGQIQRWHAES